ncbi:MAG TPA: hypothetical protein VGZ22_26210, partial [Isosphaeraceae bacterium]|nr:hypothetical protein [Isosphaeraceae bacterium]
HGGDRRRKARPHDATALTGLTLWGDHWIQPCQALLARHGHHPARQTLWNWKKGAKPVPEYVELILLNERKARKSAS